MGLLDQHPACHEPFGQAAAGAEDRVDVHSGPQATAAQGAYGAVGGEFGVQVPSRGDRLQGGPDQGP